MALTVITTDIGFDCFIVVVLKTNRRKTFYLCRLLIPSATEQLATSSFTLVNADNKWYIQAVASNEVSFEVTIAQKNDFVFCIIMLDRRALDNV
jgi:hypothetical protein